MKTFNDLRHSVPTLGLLLSAFFCDAIAQQASPADPPVPAGVEKADAGIDDALESLAKAAENFVKAFNDRDAAAIAALFTPAGEIVGSDGETVSGCQAIETYHRNLFSGEEVPLIALEAFNVELVAPGVAVEEGLIHLTLADDEPVRSVGYTVTHTKQADGSWLIAASHYRPEASTPAELIKPLHWMIGEWTLESEDGVRIDMVIDLDDRENHLLGESLITDAEGGAQSTNLRIGWNPATSSIYWWTFDSEGGNSSGPWAQRGDEWVVSTTGVTADAEACASSQTLIRDGDTMVWIATQRMLAGEAQPDLIYRFARRAPDPLSLLSPEPDETEAAGEPDAPAPAPAPAKDGE